MAESITLSPEHVLGVLKEQQTVLRWPLEEPCATISRGARLWVREHFWADTARVNRRYTDGSTVMGGPIRGPMHKLLPRQMRQIDSRLTLIVTEARIEHLHEIDDHDALMSGIIARTGPGQPVLFGMPQWPLAQCLPVPRDAFKKVWIAQYDAFKWVQNPWVERISFIHFHTNIDNVSQYVAGQALHEQMLDSRHARA